MDLKRHKTCWSFVRIALFVQLAIVILANKSQATGRIHPPRPNETSEFVLPELARARAKSISNATIPVNIRIEPLRELNRKIYVKTGTNLTATAEILDEKFRNITLTYQWSTRSSVINTTDSKESQIVYKYDRADENEVLNVLVLHRPDDTGICRKEIVVRDAIEISDPDGKTFLERGELLDIKLKFNGTGPFKFCREFCHLEKNHQCQECSPDSWTTQNEIKIVKYLRSIGNYSLVFVVDNYASRQAKIYSVRIFDTIGHQTTPIVPIVCSISAVIILLSGVILNLKCRDTAHTETADFDFTRNAYEDDDLEQFWDEELSFMQRVKYLLFEAGSDRNNTSFSDADLSNSRSRLF